MCIKNPDTEVKQFKANWILLGYFDKYRHKIASNSLMLMRKMYRAALSLSVILSKGLYGLATLRKHTCNLSDYSKISLPHPSQSHAGYGKASLDQISTLCFYKITFMHLWSVLSNISKQTLNAIRAPFNPCFSNQTNSDILTGMAGLATDNSNNFVGDAYQIEKIRATKTIVTKTRFVCNRDSWLYCRQERKQSRC